MAALLVAMAMVAAAGAPQQAAAADPKTWADLEAFDSLVIDGAARVSLSMGSEPSVSVAGSDSQLEKTSVVVADGVLTVAYHESSLKAAFTSPPTITIVVTSISSLTIKGAVKAEGTIGTDGDLVMSVDGASQLKLADLDLASLDVTIGGGSQVTLAGNALDQAITADGATFYRAGDLQSLTATVTTSNVAKVTVRVIASLTVNASGASRVEYISEAAVVDQVTTKGAKVTQGKWTPFGGVPSAYGTPEA